MVPCFTINCIIDTTEMIVFNFNKYKCARHYILASQEMPVVRNMLFNTRDIRDMGLISGSGRHPGGGNGNPLQYSHLGNPIDRGAWRTAVHGVEKRQTRLIIEQHS